MSKTLQLLKKKVGAKVVSTTLSVWFFGRENVGEIGEAFLSFPDGHRIVLGCAGDGSVRVFKAKNTEDAPGITTQWRVLPRINGILASVFSDENSIYLKIGESAVRLKNDDDLLRVMIDGRELDPEMLRRR